MNTVSGYRVVAIDGDAGVVDAHTRTGRLVVDLSPSARAVLVDVAAVARIDHRGRAVFVDRTRQDLAKCPSA
jgi:hypothetical protein